jgi:hypothetical protein
MATEYFLWPISVFLFLVWGAFWFQRQFARITWATALFAALHIGEISCGIFPTSQLSYPGTFTAATFPTRSRTASSNAAPPADMPFAIMLSNYRTGIRE